jgi:hypothetical protein
MAIPNCHLVSSDKLMLKGAESAVLMQKREMNSGNLDNARDEISVVVDQKERYG